MPAFTPALTVRIPVAWGEMDAFQHVNNTVYLRWFETARIEWLTKVGFTGTGGAGPILARTEIDYRLPVVWPDTIVVAIGVVAQGKSSVTLGYRITSENLGGAIAAEGITVIVLFDYAAKKSVPLDDELRVRIGS
ncbi:MAG: thioesterase family protein [Deltaproteobacteria bacterium]